MTKHEKVQTKHRTPANFAARVASAKNCTIEEFKVLPLSIQIALACEDLKAAKKVGHTLDFNQWVKSTNNPKVCAMCLAGAAFYMRGINIGTYAVRSEHLEVAQALDAARRGHLAAAFILRYGKEPPTDAMRNDIFELSFTLDQQLRKYENTFVLANNLDYFIQHMTTVSTIFAAHGY